jgi:hypothetical protein
MINLIKPFDMKTNAVKVPFLIMMLLLVFISCKKDKPNDNAEADVYVKSILFNGEPVFGLVQYVFGYAAMSSVTVQYPGGASDQLIAYDTEKTVFYSEPVVALGTYTGTPPEPGTYSYKVTFKDGIEKVFTNDLSSIYLLPPTITSLAKTAGSQSVSMSWEPLAGVEYFQLSIYKDGAIQYTSNPFTPPTENSLVISLSLIPSYTPGTYNFQLDAIAYEPGNTGKLQAISSASASADI